MALSNEELAKEAGVNPWKLRDDLAEGNPAEIIVLAQQFHTASGHAADATGIAATADEITAAGYRVDNTPVHDINTHLQQTRTQLGNSGENMERIARDLATIADELATRTTRAKAEVDELDSELEKLHVVMGRLAAHAYRNWPRDYEQELKDLREAAVDMVRNRGGTIRDLVDGYEEILTNRLEDLAEMGYGTPDELDVGGMDASDAAQATLDAIDNGNRTEALKAYDNATAYIDILNTKARHGPLSYEETKWLNDYYDKVVPHFGKINDWLCLNGSGFAAKVDTALHHAEEMSNRGAVLADGLLNLTQAIEDLQKQAEQDKELPPLAGSIQDIVTETKLQLEYPPGWLESPMGGGGVDYTTFTVTGLEEASDFSGFLQRYASDNVSPGEDFAKDMANAGVRWKDQFDGIKAELEERAASGGGITYSSIGAEKALAGLSDKFASDALTVAAHNPDAAASVLAENQDLRHTVLNSEWEHDQGAAALVAVGTAHNPDNVSADSNKAALKVMQEIAHDPIDFNDTFGDIGVGKPHLRNALTVMAIDHMDTFALYPEDYRDKADVHNVPTPDGTQAVVRLSNDDLNGFLTFIGTDDRSHALFRTTALERGSEWIEYGIKQPLGPGHPDFSENDFSEYQRAVNNAARLEGRSTAASLAALDAMATAEGQENREKYIEAYQEYRDNLADDALTRGIWNTAQSASGIASHFGGPMTRVGMGGIDSWMSGVNDQWSAPSFEEQTHERIVQLDREDEREGVAEKYERHFEVNRGKAIDWMLLSAVASTDPHDPVLNGITKDAEGGTGLTMRPLPGSPSAEPEKLLPSMGIPEAQSITLRKNYKRDGVVWENVDEVARTSGLLVVD